MHTFAEVGEVVARARWLEARAFDGLLVADSQCLGADLWVELGVAAAATERLRLGPGVTNPRTRDPSVTASAALTLQAESGGRAVLGVGRGDTALTELGERPVPVAELERALGRLRAYLSGEEVSVDGHAVRLKLADRALPPVPLEVAASGPRTIAAAARHADRISFSVGAEPERVRWAVAVARDARDRAGLDPGGLRLGAYVHVAVDSERASARELIAGAAAAFAGFSVDGELSGRLLDRFAVVGPADECAQRIATLGLDHVIVVPPSLGADPNRVREANERFADEVLPRLRSAGRR
jgi:5,10-methylenetetrahydromethanopterin reductase